MQTMKTVGVLVLATVVLAAIGGCKSKESAEQNKPGVGSVSRPGLVENVGTPPNTTPVQPSDTAPAKDLTLDLGNNVSMKLVLIPAGKFMMGSPKDEKDRQDNEGLAPGTWVNGNPQIEVTISKPFYLGVYDVTVDQYALFVKDTGQSHSDPSFKQTGDHPVVNVSWDDAQAFYRWLSKKTGKAVQLPTEAQWEYACRAGSKTRFCYGDDDDKLGDYAWYSKNSDNTTHPVGQKKPNEWDLYDMHGNVWQWCSDRFADSYANANDRDPQGPGSGLIRVLRGGCWGSDPQGCRSASRFRGGPVSRYIHVGFRVVVDFK